MSSQKIEFEGLGISLLPTVYPPAEDSFLLAKWAAKLAGGKVLELGCGSGIVSLAIANADAKSSILGVDINPRAVECSRGNAIANKIKNAKFLASDLFFALGRKKFNWIVFNPPYLPTAKNEKLANAMENAAYDGGRDGRAVIVSFLSQFGKCLTKKGSALLVSSSRSGTGKTVAELETLGFGVRILESIPFFFEKLSLIHATKRKLDYGTALSEMRSLEVFGSRLGLERVGRLLDALGNPEGKFRVISVAGTNGKGSVAAMVASILHEAGFRVGLYTSPHVDDFRERFCVNGKMISEGEFVREYARVDGISQKMEDRPTFFEVTTAIALDWFAQKKVDFAVLEAGLGGRLDATNAADAEVSVITGIGLEHTRELGNSLPEIAREKAGVIKPGSSVVVGKMEKEARDAVIADALGKNAKAVYAYGRDFSSREIACTGSGSRFGINIGGGKFDATLSLLGRWQGQNAACACAAVRALLGADIPKRAMLSGLEKACIPARLEIVSKKPLVVMDAAHNPQAIEALSQSLSLFKYRKLILVFGAMADKDIGGMLRIIGPRADKIIINQPKVSRAAKASEVAKIAEKYCKKVSVAADVKNSVAYAKKIAGKNDLVLITGSIYMLSEARGKDKLGIPM